MQGEERVRAVWLDRSQMDSVSSFVLSGFGVEPVGFDSVCLEY